MATVLCPFCHKNHRHGIDSGLYDDSQRLRRRRLSHCEGLGRHRADANDQHSSFDQSTYEMSFPFNLTTGKVGFYVDKGTERYVAIGAQLEPANSQAAILSNQDGENHAKGPAESKRAKWKDGAEMYTVDSNGCIRKCMEALGIKDEEPYQDQRIHLALSNLVTGDTTWVEEYLNDSSETALFLNGIGERGETALHLAACEGCPDMVDLLLKHNVDANVADSSGRTPLMEAALWGRLQNFCHILRHGADAYAKDHDGLTAMDLASPSQRNEDERYHRFERMLTKGSSKTISIYNMHQRSRERRTIFNTLETMAEASNQARENTSLAGDEKEDFAFITSFERHSISLVKTFPVPRTTKTIARLIYPPTMSGKVSPVDAMSGWGHTDSADEVVVDGRSWTQEVIELAAYLGYELPTDTVKDQGCKGRFAAGHAEKQLISYFVNSHVVLGDNGDALVEAVPPVMLKQGRIIVSRPVCYDCNRFVEFVNDEL